MNKAMDMTYSILGRTKKPSLSSSLEEGDTGKGSSFTEEANDSTDVVEGESNTVQDNPPAGEGDNVGEIDSSQESNSTTSSSGKTRKPRSSTTTN